MYTHQSEKHAMDTMENDFEDIQEEEPDFFLSGHRFSIGSMGDTLMGDSGSDALRLYELLKDHPMKTEGAGSMHYPNVGELPDDDFDGLSTQASLSQANGNYGMSSFNSYDTLHSYDAPTFHTSSGMQMDMAPPPIISVTLPNPGILQQVPIASSATKSTTRRKKLTPEEKQRRKEERLSIRKQKKSEREKKRRVLENDYFMELAELCDVPADQRDKAAILQAVMKTMEERGLISTDNELSGFLAQIGESIKFEAEAGRLEAV